MLALALGLAACGSSASTRVSFTSPAVVDGALPSQYTCDGQNIPPPLEWGTVPSATRELALFMLGLKPTPRAGIYTASVEWAVAGIRPSLHKLAAGQLPPGAHVGRVSNGKTRYSVCPAKGSGEVYEFALYAVPASVTVSPRFEGARLLSTLASPSSPTAHVHGSFIAGYTRVAAIALSSSAVQGGELSALYTCNGQNISPPLVWGAVPPGVKELAVFLLNRTPGAPGGTTIEWVMAGINPALHSLAAGQVPQGAFLEAPAEGSKTRYSVCPPKGRTEHYAFALYALPARARTTPRLPGADLLVNLTSANPLTRSPAIGELSATYTGG